MPIVMSDYRSPMGHTSIYRMVPIAALDDFRGWARLFGNQYKIRYRGPRCHRGAPGTWARYAARAHCLKGDATHFTVYPA